MSTARTSAVLVTAAFAAWVAAPGSAGAAGPVIAGPAGEDMQLAVAQLAPNRASVKRFVFVYIAECADGSRTIGWTGFNRSVRLRRKRFVLDEVQAGALTITVRARRVAADALASRRCPE